MPDWSYRTVFQPLLFRLPFETARDLAFGAMGRLSRMPLGTAVIDFMGHMRPAGELSRTVSGIEFPSPVGIGCTVDAHGVATGALARFGAAFIEVGPIAVEPIATTTRVERRDDLRSLHLPATPASDGLAVWQERLATHLPRDVRCFARLIVPCGTQPDQATKECRAMIERLRGCVDGFVVATSDEALHASWTVEQWRSHVESLVACLAADSGRQSERRRASLWLAIRADLDREQIAFVVRTALNAGCSGVLVDGRVTDSEAGGWLFGQAAFEPSRLTVIQLRERFGDALSIIAGGVHEPIEALELLDAGANLTLVDAGLVYSGPGLFKRINEAVAFDEQQKWQARRLNTTTATEEPARNNSPLSEPLLPPLGGEGRGGGRRVRSICHLSPLPNPPRRGEGTRRKPGSDFAPDPESHSESQRCDINGARPALDLTRWTWFWTLLLGLGLLLGGLLALGIASTRVILPYDEVFVGMSREELNLISPRLLAFMQHDRVTLSGTMLSVAVMYLFLSWHGIRHGAHWAMMAVLVSALTGFGSFFLFLGFGYFDPFHAFVTAVMFQFLLMAWSANLGPVEWTSPPNLREDWTWRLAQWGQLAFVIHAAVLIVAGSVICGVGCTTVFVPEDLEFMDVCPSDLSLANPRLIPLIAHDRASFGGMLITTGVAVLLTSLWGLRQGASWQWWMLLLAGFPAYGLAIGVHLAVGYTSGWHLVPAYGGLALLMLGLALLWPHVGRRHPTSLIAASTPPAIR